MQHEMTPIATDALSKAFDPVMPASPDMQLAPPRPLSQTPFRLTYAPAGESGLAAWIATPAQKTSLRPLADPPLVAIHGIARDAREQAALLGRTACETGRTIIAPHFDKKSWRAYQRVVHGTRADLALLRLLAELEDRGFLSRTDAPGRGFHLFGYSGGAQFAHRFSLLHPHMVKTLTIAAAGWYTFPDMAAFPYGFGPAFPRRDHKKDTHTPPHWGAVMEANLASFLEIPLLVLVGARDCVVDKNTRKGDAINRQQGRTRIGRARNWTKAMKETALALGKASNIDFQILPGCGHSFSACVHKGELDQLIIQHITASRKGDVQ
ncbi:MAG: hypothetical protein AAGA09_00950 [Pseudomonadota bacterium]